MTIEQYNNLKPFEGEMQQIIRNNAIISTPIEFRETIHRIGKELGYNVKLIYGPHAEEKDIKI